MSGPDEGELLRALAWAEELHRHQKRKGRNAPPYIGHPIAVANLLAEHGVTDHSTLVAAILHDVVEDTSATIGEVGERFGPDVAGLVAEMTDDTSLSKARRKQLQIEHAPQLSPAARLIKLADKTINVRDVTRDPPHDWPVTRRRDYFDWAEKVIGGLRGTNEKLEAAFDAALADGRSHLEPVIGS